MGLWGRRRRGQPQQPLRDPLPPWANLGTWGVLASCFIPPWAAEPLGAHAQPQGKRAAPPWPRPRVRTCPCPGPDATLPSLQAPRQRGGPRGAGGSHGPGARAGRPPVPGVDGEVGRSASVPCVRRVPSLPRPAPAEPAPVGKSRRQGAPCAHIPLGLRVPGSTAALALAGPGVRPSEQRRAASVRQGAARDGRVLGAERRGRPLAASLSTGGTRAGGVQAGLGAHGDVRGFQVPILPGGPSGPSRLAGSPSPPCPEDRSPDPCGPLSLMPCHLPRTPRSPARARAVGLAPCSLDSEPSSVTRPP